MKFKILFTSISIIVCTQSAWAVKQTFTPMEKICPRVEAIKAVGLAYAEKEDDGSWVAANQNHYNTPYLWEFLISNAKTHKISPQFDSDAMQKAKQALQSLKFEEIVDGQKNIFCSYSANNGVTAIAVAKKAAFL